MNDNLAPSAISPKSFDLKKLRAQENEYWEAWFHDRPKSIGNSNEAALIRLRNRLKVSRINHFIEYLYVRRVRRGF